MIEELRNGIDRIDDEIARLYLERQAVVKRIGEEKAASKVPVADPGREKKIIARVTKSADEEQKMYLKLVFDAILETSRAYQRRLVSPRSELADTLRAAIMAGQKDFPVSAAVACQGVEGSYSSIAADKLFKIADVTYFRTFEGVFQAVEKGLCEYGVLPIENSAVGSVNAVYDLMKKHRFYIVRGVKLKISHYLLAKRGVGKNEIDEIYSHEQALGQCADFIASLGGNVKINVCSNTAVAADIVARSENPRCACISSRNCADLYGLGIVESNVQDSDSNYTRFICIGKKLELFAPNNRISIMMTLPHESGALNKILNKFSTLGLNLTKLESRPLAGTDFEFMFYFDFEGRIENSDTLALISELDSGSEQFFFLGSYFETV